jgi:hypothetical protein
LAPTPACQPNNRASVGRHDRQRGASRLARIAAALERHGADILVLSEYRGGQSAVRLAPLYLFATTRVRNEPIAGELISTMSPGFRKRSGAEVLSGNKSLESAAVPAAVPPLIISPG